MRENLIYYLNQKHDGPEAKGSNPTTGLTLLWARNHSGEILTTGKSHGLEIDYPG